MDSIRRIYLVSLLAAGVLALAAAEGQAQTAQAQAAQVQAAAGRGTVTNLPLPRFVTLKASEANVRRGPSLTHRIDWVFTAKGMPLEVVGEYGHWRRVRDHDGVGGWVHYTLLSGARAGLVDTDGTPLYARADPASPLNARLETGVIVALDRCGAVWCRGKAGGLRGWVAKSDLWGVGGKEMFD